MTLYEDSISNAMRIYTEGRLVAFKSISQAAYLIRYFRYLGKPEEEIKVYIERLFYNIYGVPSRPDMSIYYNKSAKYADRLSPLEYISVGFTKAELDYIHSLDNIYGEIFVFCVLVAYKYKVATKQDAKFDVLWDDAIKPTMVGLKTLFGSRINFNNKVNEFIRTNDCVRTRIFKNKDIVSIDDELLSLDDGNYILTIDSFIDVAYYYIEYLGLMKFFRCENCGCIFPKPRANVKCCKPCARRVHIIKVGENKARFKTQNVKNP